MDNNFEDKTVIITGGSEGVGAACARRFASAGANLVLVARSKKNLERIATELRGKTRNKSFLEILDLLLLSLFVFAFDFRVCTKIKKLQV